MTGTWLVIAAVGFGSFALRFLPLLLAGRLRWPDWVSRALRHVGTATLVYVTVTAAVAAGRGGWPQAAGMLAGLSAAGWLSWRGHRPLTVVAAGLALAWLVTAAAA